MSKSKQNRKRNVPTDEPYVQNINLVTGDKFDYDRPLLTEREISQLCFDESKSHVEKFLYILEQGEKIQVWSIFQNLSKYVRNGKDAIIIFDAIQKNYAHLTDFLPILSDGITDLLTNPPENLPDTCISTIFDLCFRTFSLNPTFVDDWSKVLEQMSKHSNKLKLQNCVNYISGSFSMNSPPEKRRVAFCMIRHLMDVSQEIKKGACSKILFFNQDLNPKTRFDISEIINKILSRNQGEEQIWKALWEYYQDKDETVKENAIKILTSIFYLPNFQVLIQCLNEPTNQTIFCKNIVTFILCFREQIQNDSKEKMQIISFYNRVFKSKKLQNAVTLLQSLNQSKIIQIFGEGKIFDDLNFSALPLKNPQIIGLLSSLYHIIQGIQFKDFLKIIIIKSLKQIDFQLFTNCSNFAFLLDLTQQQQIQIYMQTCSKMLQSSKWYPLLQMLQIFNKLSMYQMLYDKICQLMLRIWMNCPNFMQQKVIQCVMYLVLVNKRSLQFLITIREKVLNSKFWNHRKNYILFYAAMKQSTSFEFHKLVPSLVYKILTQDKSIGVRLTLLDVLPKIYKYTDPSATAEKATIRESIQKFQQDKDLLVKEKAQQIKVQIQNIDKDVNWLAELYDRSRQMGVKQVLMNQVTYEPKRITKTDHDIIKSGNKPKRVSSDKRKTINIVKGMHKESSIDSIGIGSIKNNSSMPPKRSNLFRCHSVKIKAPVKKP